MGRRSRVLIRVAAEAQAARAAQADLNAPSVARRVTLRPDEVGWLLGLTVRQVRAEVRGGRLAPANVGRSVRVDPAAVRERLGDRPVALWALEAVIRGELRAPRPGAEESAPESLEGSVARLWREARRAPSR